MYFCAQRLGADVQPLQIQSEIWMYTAIRIVSVSFAFNMPMEAFRKQERSSKWHPQIGKIALKWLWETSKCLWRPTFHSYFKPNYIIVGCNFRGFFCVLRVSTTILRVSTLFWGSSLALWGSLLYSKGLCCVLWVCMAGRLSIPIISMIP